MVELVNTRKDKQRVRETCRVTMGGRGIFRINKFGVVGDSVKDNAVCGEGEEYQELVALNQLRSGVHSRVSFDRRWLLQG